MVNMIILLIFGFLTFMILILSADLEIYKKSDEIIKFIDSEIKKGISNVKIDA